MDQTFLHILAREKLELLRYIPRFHIAFFPHIVNMTQGCYFKHYNYNYVYSIFKKIVKHGLFGDLKLSFKMFL